MRRGIACALVALGAMLALPAGAGASFHFMLVSEVFPGTAAQSFDDAFVELQMYSGGQNFVDGKQVSYYTSGGINTPVSQFSANVANGDNQRTILIGDSAVAAPDLLDNSLSGHLDASGGAVCFEDPASPGPPIDCVAWGPFVNTAGLPVGNPEAAIPAGQSLTRSLAPGCATLLEAGDDTDDSATDFAPTAPSPRNNATAPTEEACGGGGNGGGNPDTEITKAPKKKTEKTKAKFKFSSDTQGAEFECKLDKGGFKACDSPQKYKKLDPGKHRFQVRATAAGKTDSTPAKHKWKVLG